MLAVTLLLAACGSSSRHPDVALLPASGASGDVSHWTARCPLAPVGGERCAAAGPTFGFAQLNGDAWNLGGPADAGSIDMSMAPSGAATIEGNFTSTPPCTDPACIAPSAYTWVRGYPNVLYGLDQCRAGSSPPSSPRLPLPMRLDAIPPHLIGVTAYSTQMSQVTHDVAYDLWLNPTATKQPCRSDGTLEIMVWTDYDARALLPASLKVGTATVPSALDGVARPNTREWSIYASNIGRDGQTAPWGGTLWFVPDQADVAGHGRVSVDLSAVLWAADLLLQQNYGWSRLAQRYWLDTASFGMEFGPQNGETTDSGPSRFSAQISAYCLDVRSTVLNAACS